MRNQSAETSDLADKGWTVMGVVDTIGLVVDAVTLTGVWRTRTQVMECRRQNADGSREGRASTAFWPQSK
jgi:hypothetical protein